MVPRIFVIASRFFVMASLPPPENPRQYWLLEHWTALYLISTLLLLIMPVEN